MKDDGGLSSKCLTIRDYFAAKAMQGLLADPNEVREAEQSVESFAEEIAKGSYIYADAMLEARKQ